MLTIHAARERKYFDHVVAEQGDFNPFADRGWAVLQRCYEAWAVEDGASTDTKPRLLDIGAGTGQSRQLYASTVREYVGLDISPAAVERARRRFPVSQWVVGDACKLTFDDDSFDVVAFSSVLHHLPDIPRALSEALRVLRPGGKVFAFDPNLLNPAMALLRWPKSPLYCSQGVSPNESPLFPAHLYREFQAVGFTSLRQRCRSGITYRAVAPKLANSLLGAFGIADELWERCGLGRWFGTFVLTYGEKPGSPKQTAAAPSVEQRRQAA